MRVLLVAGILLAIGGMALFVLFDRNGAPNLPQAATGETPSRADAVPGAPIASERSQIDRGARPEAPENDAPEPEEAAEVDENPERAEDDGRGTFLAHVFDAVANKPMPRFRYVLDLADGTREAKLVEGHELRIRIPRTASGNLVVEADGYEPSEPRAVSGAEPMPPWPTLIELVPAMAHSGVEYWVQAPDGTPVQQLDVEALPLDHAGAPARALWRRTAANAQGRYELPDFKPGRYRLRLRAAPGEKGPSTHRVHEHEFQFTGTERIVENVRLKPGAVLLLEASDVTGKALGREVSVRVVHPDGEARPVRWTADDRGNRVERIDGLPAASPSRTGDPLAAGTYTLELRGPSNVTVREIVDLIAGQVRTLRVTVP